MNRANFTIKNWDVEIKKFDGTESIYGHALDKSEGGMYSYYPFSHTGIPSPKNIDWGILEEKIPTFVKEAIYNKIIKTKEKSGRKQNERKENVT